MEKRSGQQTAHNKAMLIFKEHSGTLRTGEALKAGIHPRILYSLRDQCAPINNIWTHSIKGFGKY